MLVKGQICEEPEDPLDSIVFSISLTVGMLLQVLPTGASGTAELFARSQAKRLFAVLHIAGINKTCRSPHLEEDSTLSDRASMEINSKSSRISWHQVPLPLETNPGVIRLLGLGAYRNLSKRLSRSLIARTQPDASRQAAVSHNERNRSYQLGSCQDGVSSGPPSSFEIQAYASSSPTSQILTTQTQPIPMLRVGGNAIHTDHSSLAVPGAENDPLLVVEYCTTWLPYDLARLPELDLGDGLSRAMHCYAHGGFMGAAISMLADPEWEHILLDTVHETVTLASKKQVHNIYVYMYNVYYYNLE